MDNESWIGVVGIILKISSSEKINWNNAEFRRIQEKAEETLN